LLRPNATVVLQMEVPPAETSALIARARARGARLVLNLAPAGWLEEAVLRAVDVLVVNETEGVWLGAHLRGDSGGVVRPSGRPRRGTDQRRRRRRCRRSRRLVA
ncbi:MAG: ribokinase, partial [Acetobacteraceae bacterium]|nr:ribokinase [Acetobacteraceae bacterium]